MKGTGRSRSLKARCCVGNRAADFSRLALRLTVGGLFVGHGGQKLFGWFGGSGLEGTATEMEELGLNPGRANAIAAGVSQLGGGLSVASGLATPIGCAALTTSMITAIRTACSGKGPWGRDGGYEYPLVLSAALLLIASEGPGSHSLDRLLGVEQSGPLVGTAALAAALAGSNSALRQLVTDYIDRSQTNAASGR